MFNSMPQYDSDRPSLWPVRNQRRHAAVVQFNGDMKDMITRVLDQLSALSTKVAEISSSQSMLEQKLLPNSINGDMEKLETRITSMELLLFRTSLKDFGAIDEQVRQMRMEELFVQHTNRTSLGQKTVEYVDRNTIEQILPKCVPISTLEEKVQPEAEWSPSASKDSSLESIPDKCHRADESSCCLNFDIYSEVGSECQPEADITEGPTQTCRRLLQAFGCDLKELLHQGKEEAFRQVVLEKFDPVFSQLPRCYATRTQLTRKEYENKYGSIHRTALWSDIVRKYHQNTGDPLSKSNAFLDVMLLLWEFKTEDQHS